MDLSSVKVGCLGGGGGATLLEINNKRLLLFGIASRT
jgi:hypothetical protein